MAENKFNVLSPKPDYYSLQLRNYAGQYGDRRITLFIDRMPLSEDDLHCLAELFPNGHIVMCEEICQKYGKDFFDLDVDCLEAEPVCLLLETSAKRVDFLTELLCKKGVMPQNILTGACERREIVEIGELLCGQHFDTEIYSEDTFSRYAVMIRLLFIEAYDSGKETGYALYRKYLQAKGYGRFEYYKEKFIDLICSFREKGAHDLWIAADEAGRIIDGSHRLAICLNEGIGQVQVRYMNSVERLYSDKEWLEKFFSPQEQRIVVGKYHEVMGKYL